jgi:hypothetical protein
MILSEPLSLFAKDGKLFGSQLPHQDDTTKIASILQLKCATDLMFPGEEDTLEDLRQSSIEYLTELLENDTNISKALSSQVINVMILFERIVDHS